MKRERYVVFSGDSYYPSGGVMDIAGSVPDLSMVKDIIDGLDDWVNVLDLVTGESIYPENIEGCEDYNIGGFDAI